jgi:integrase/recombinase XerD
MNSKEVLISLIISKLEAKDELSLNNLFGDLIKLENEVKDIRLLKLSKEDLRDRYISLNLINRSRNTKKSYEYILSNFLNSVYPTFTIDEISLYLKSKEEGWKQNTKARNYIVIKDFLSFLNQSKYIKEDLAEMIKIPKKVNTEQYVPDDKDITDFFIALEELYKNKESYIRYRTIFVVYAKTGLRLNELINLNFEDIDFNKRHLLLKQTKNKDEDIIPMDIDLEKIIRKYLEKYRISEGSVFRGMHNKRIHKNTIRKSLKKIKDKARLPTKFTIHSFRRYFLDKLRRVGVDIFVMKELARHKDINTTYKYCNVEEKELRYAISKIKLQEIY